MSDEEFNIPAQLAKMELYIVDLNNMGWDQQDWEGFISQKLNTVSMNASPQIFNFKARVIQWNDEIDLNNTGCKKENYDEYFKE
jgi:hypothetical protein